MTKELAPTQTTALAPGAMGSIESNRAIAEVQGQVLMAKQFPRNLVQARFDVLEACKRFKLAESALYSYPRGGSRVEGPSIRLAEAIAQNWGNIDYGVIELDQKPGIGNQPGESVVMAYCRDIQKNTRRQMVFTVPHIRYSKAKGNTPLTDPRDIYEMTANMGARRLRACILGIIPGDIIEEAVEACNKTLAGNNDEPLINRITKMVSAFKEFGVSQAMLEKRLGHKMESTLIFEVVQLGKIFKSLKDGMSAPKDWFEIKDVSAVSSTDAAPAPASKSKKTASAVHAPEKQADTSEKSDSVVDELQNYWMDTKKYGAVWQKLLDGDNPLLSDTAVETAIKNKNSVDCQHITRIFKEHM